MSGICGICEPGRPLRSEALEAMVAALRLPGDSEASAVFGASAALSVVPRWSFQQSATLPGLRVVADAELLNKPQLERELSGAIPNSKELSGAELVGHLYSRFGLEFVQLLDGPFSFALWDERSERAVLGIDRLGVNALYWSKRGNSLLFASRIGAIRELLGDSARINRAALMQFLLFSAVPAPLTIYEDVEKLSPGHFLVYEKGTLRVSRYWDLEYVEEERRSDEEWAGLVRAGLRSAVQKHMCGDDPSRLGAYLSGGTDSSSVVAFMNEKHAPVNTFSIFFENENYSEIGFARTTADRFKTRHHELSLRPVDAFEAISKISHYYDEPFANSSAIGGYHCARMARENGVHTLLAGDGGDELFGGNERYATDKRFSLYHRIPKWLRRGVIEPAIRILPKDDGRAGLPRRYVRRANIPTPRRIYSYGLFLTENPRNIFEPDFLSAAPPENWMAIADAHFAVGTNRTELNRLLYLDVKMTLADNDLRKVLGTAELAGVRARFPLVDFHLAELSARIPSNLKLRGFEKRYIFKQAMKGILPEQVLYKKKHGFGVPVSLWFAEDPKLDTLLKDVLSDRRTRQRGYFRPSFYDEAMRRHREEDAKNFGEILWFLLVLELWHREHFEIPVNTACAS